MAFPARFCYFLLLLFVYALIASDTAGGEATQSGAVLTIAESINYVLNSHAHRLYAKFCEKYTFEELIQLSTMMVVACIHNDDDDDHEEQILGEHFDVNQV
ncbi:hypothetical protein PRIPAC_79550 [Pristionchus pacificus]|uniref:Uncharacterized protein n=1 Tax=Pristionchus pacificus TaxID=54126 RepID=A0A2A6BVV8_PRIPA|nr:hypothetical protein PRIPAC_79550 [Pristionchus pacificus]|eukprot:PDM70050.1 hypothetical protein PRIPAC_49262 [Pristionchus pacificus]